MNRHHTISVVCTVDFCRTAMKTLLFLTLWSVASQVSKSFAPAATIARASSHATVLAAAAAADICPEVPFTTTNHHHNHEVTLVALG